MTYLVLVSPAREVPREVRAQQFAEYLGSLVKRYAQTESWTVKEFLENAGIPKGTFYRWRSGNWAGGAPSLPGVRDFHTRLGISPSQALSILGFDLAAAGEDPLAAADPAVAEDIRLILRRLADPNEDPDDLTFIRRSLANLAGRSPSGSRRPRNRSAV